MILEFWGQILHKIRIFSQSDPNLFPFFSFLFFLYFQSWEAIRGRSNLSRIMWLQWLLGMDSHVCTTSGSGSQKMLPWVAALFAIGRVCPSLLLPIVLLLECPPPGSFHSQPLWSSRFSTVPSSETIHWSSFPKSLLSSCVPP